MIFVTSLVEFDGIDDPNFEYPVLVASEFSSGFMGSVKKASNREELRPLVEEALHASVTTRALIYQIANGLGALMNMIEQDTMCSSDPAACVNHPHYPKVLDYGDIAVRYVLTKMAAGEIELSFFSILHDITDAQPIKHGHAGDIDAMRVDWIEWAKDNGKLDQLAWDLLKD